VSGHGNPGLLLDTLAMTVPLEIGRLRDAGQDARDALAQRLRWPRDPDGRYALTGADAMLYGGKGAGGAFAGFATAIALLSFAPGGVTFGGLAWCAAHPRQRWAGGDRICPACLREEIAAGGAG
jgi:hypothetical protein